MLRKGASLSRRFIKKAVKHLQQFHIKMMVLGSVPAHIDLKQQAVPEAVRSGIQRYLLPDRQGQCPYSAVKQLQKMDYCIFASHKNMGLKSEQEMTQGGEGAQGITFERMA